MRCWGDVENDLGQLTVPVLNPPQRWRDVGAGAYHACDILQDNTIRCWGGSGYEGFNILGDATTPGRTKTWALLAVGWWHTCAIRDFASGVDSSCLECWGFYNQVDALVPEPNSAWLAVSAGDGFTCGIRAGAQNITCWQPSWGNLNPLHP